MEIKLTKENFEQEVLQSDVPVLVDFWAEWCGPCRMLGPEIEALATKVEGRAKVGKVNIDDEPELAMRYGVSVIPTLKVFRNGKVTGGAVGMQTPEALEDLLQ